MQKESLKLNNIFLKKNFSLIVLSCDKFYDTWKPLIYSFKRYWPNCPINRYFLTNKKSCVSNFFLNVKVGNDQDWSTNLINALKKIKTKYIILWIDDAFLVSPVDNKKLIKDFRWCVSVNADYLRLTNFSKYINYFSTEYSLIDNNHPYRTSIFASIWRIDVLKKLIIRGENPWQFELRGSLRSHNFKKFYSVNSSRFQHIHGIEQGVWLRNAVRWIKKNKLFIDLDYRPQMSQTKSLLRDILQFKSFFLNIFSANIQKKLLFCAQKIYLFLGFRHKNFYKNK
jgi:hypothetical protein